MTLMWGFPTIERSEAWDECSSPMKDIDRDRTHPNQHTQFAQWLRLPFCPGRNCPAPDFALCTRLVWVSVSTI